MRSLIAVGLEHLLADDRFNSFEKMFANLAVFKELVAEAYLEYTTDEVLEKLKAADVPCARCLSKDEVLAQPQVEANDTVGKIDHPIMGKMRVVKLPARFGGERLAPAPPSPDRGQHTDEVLLEFGVDDTRLGELREAGVVS